MYTIYMNPQTPQPLENTAPSTSFAIPVISDLPEILRILSQWVDEAEAQKYIVRIKDCIEGRSEYGMRFYAMKDGDAVIGVGGLADPLPLVIPYAKTAKPAELKILYLDNNIRGKGYGKSFLEFLEKKALSDGRTELLVRSAEQFRETAFGFYLHCGYEDLGSIVNDAGRPMELFRKILI